jgi:anti-sigma-K factor RskA
LNLKEYISSGIIESYVLGLASEPERTEFEMMCKHYPEVAKAKEDFERSLEQTLMSDAPSPPAFLKEQILHAVREEQAPVSVEDAVEETPVRSIGVWKWLAAACFILLLGSLVGIYLLNQKNSQLQQANTELNQQLGNATAELNSMHTDADMLHHASMKMTPLQGTQVAPQALATVYWDTTSRDVYLMVNNLPQPASDKQYQLWALLNGHPIDLGVFDIKQQRLLVRMKNVQNAQAFAITLEPKGGSASPTMNNMYVMGKL